MMPPTDAAAVAGRRESWSAAFLPTEPMIDAPEELRPYDADGLLDPGKAVPTLQRCAEYGAMHVRHAGAPWPDLERF
jgi:hypothetical protein